MKKIDLGKLNKEKGIRIINEMSILNTALHPNLIFMADFFIQHHQAYLIMEYANRIYLQMLSL
jgi:hypothetical protein